MENESGQKYFKKINGLINGKIDVYSVLISFGVTCPARQHAIKKLLCAGARGKNSIKKDLEEARDAITRAIQLVEETKQTYYIFYEEDK